MRIDLLLHFLISFIVTIVVIFGFLSFTPTFKSKSPRFWQSERKIRNRFLALVFIIAIAYSFVVGIGKEWLDYWGFGNVQMSDVVADVLGIIVGSWMMTELLKQRYRNRRQVNFSSSAKKQKQNHIILFRSSNQETKPSQTQVKINKDHASFLFEQNDDDE